MAAAFLDPARLRKAKFLGRGMIGMSAVGKLFTPGDIKMNALYWAVPTGLRIDLLNHLFLQNKQI